MPVEPHPVTSASHLSRQFTRRTLPAIVALLVVASLLALFSLVKIARELDAQALQKSEFFAAKAIENRREALARSIVDYAFWGDAYRHLVGDIDLDWAYQRQNLGSTLYPDFGYEGVLVIDDAQQTRYAVVEGELAQTDARLWLQGGLTQLLEQAQSASEDDQGAVALLLADGEPAMVAAALISPGGDPSVSLREESALLLFVDRLTPAKLRALGESYALDNLHVPPVPLRGQTRLQLQLANGNPLELAWRAPEPGTLLLKQVLPWMAAAAVILALLSWAVLRNAIRSTRQMDASYRQLQRSREALQASEVRFRDIAEAASDWLWETDEQLRLSYLSGRFESVTGYPAQNWLGRPLSELLAGSEQSLENWIKAARPGELRCTYRASDQHLRICRLVSRPVSRRAGGACGYRGTVSDITEEVEANRRIQHLSQHDSLTNLPNRSQLCAFLDERLASRQPLAVLSLDLDRFKPVNDTLGHAAGDLVLREVAQRLCARTRDEDLVARLGGDEFILILCGLTAQEGLERFCARLLEELAEPYYYLEQEIFVGASIGIALAPQDSQDTQELLRYSDIALYQAKADGRATWRFYAAEMNRRLLQRRQLELDLRQALAENQLRLHYQPRYRIEGRQLLGAEALVRWQHPTRGLLLPEHFIALAEETGLIQPLGQWVLREACLEARHWPDDLVVSVNVSPVQFSRGNLLQDVRDCLAESGLPAARLELELTERVMLEDADGAWSTLNELKALGLRLTMDDFGTGYSSLSYLRRYPFDGIKIDRSFIDKMTQSSGDRSIIQAIVGLAQALGLSVTAEGVEDDQQLAMLELDHCAEAQGFLLARPQPAAALRELMEGSSSLS